MKILTVVGARPQFVNAACVSRVIATKAHVYEVLVHTGQHFDKNMSDIFFKEIANRFGEYSHSLKFLYNNQLLKIIAHDLLCVSISKKNKSVELVFLPSEVT